MKRHTPAILERARRHRAGLIGLLEACQHGSHGRVTCAYPVVLAETSTGHELDCPAHGMTLSCITAIERATGGTELDAEPTTDEKDPTT